MAIPDGNTRWHARFTAAGTRDFATIDDLYSWLWLCFDHLSRPAQRRAAVCHSVSDHSLAVLVTIVLLIAVRLSRKCVCCVCAVCVLCVCCVCAVCVLCVCAVYVPFPVGSVKECYTISPTSFLECCPLKYRPPVRLS